MSVKRLLSGMDSKELSEWAAYYSIEPFGYFRSADLPAGIIASTIANCNRTRSCTVFQPKDFMPIGEHTKPQLMEEEDMLEVMRHMAEQTQVQDK